MSVAIAMSPHVGFLPRSVEEIPQAAIQARLAVAAVRVEQDMLRQQGQDLVRLIEGKGSYVDAYA